MSRTAILPAQHVYAPGELPAQAAARILELERGRFPDLGHAVVLLPTLHAVSAMARALQKRAGMPLLLPRMTTLAAWAAQAKLDRPVTPRVARVAALYEALVGHGWLPQADLWAVAGELEVLFGELTRSAVALPATVDQFAAQLEQAYRARRGEALQFEARLVHELWHALTGDSETLDAEAGYQLRLAALARMVTGPLYAVGLPRLSRAEADFLDACAARVPVQVFAEDRARAGNPMAAMLALAWPAVADAPDLPARARTLRAAEQRSAAAGRMRLFGAASAEEEAQAVDVTVREWLLAGKREIAVVVFDRLVARRARALLERANVLVRDEAGWAFSTTSAATVISRWLDVAAGDCYCRDLLDLLKSPFVLHDWPRDARQQAVWRLERYVREANVLSGLSRFVALAEAHDDAEVRQILLRVQRGLTALGRGRRPVVRWLAALEASLAEIGVRDGLAADQAGEQLLELLARLADQLAASGFAVDFPEWRRWLARELEAATFADRSIDSPVLFTSLAATRMRAFDAVLILGADAAHLPGADPAALFFNQGVRAQLGLPVYADTVSDIESDLAALLASCGAVLVTWQRLVGGEPNLLAPPFERLAALHELAYGDGFEEPALAACLTMAEVAGDAALLSPPAAAPAPSAAALVPEAISASAYNTLMACPYQYHARHLLRLAELDDVQELIDKADYGSIVHGVLKMFHAAHPQVSELAAEAACTELERLSVQAFAGAVAQNLMAQAWLERWRAMIPAYIDWQRGREAAGWRWYAGEDRREIIVTSPAGARLRLHGRIDRIDRHADGAVAVIDYKTQRAAALNRRVQAPGEDVQLSVYALLWGGPVAEALFLSLDGERIAEARQEGDPAGLAAGVGERLGELYDGLRAGAPLPAQGVEAVCDYCEMRGLCRRDYWT